MSTTAIAADAPSQPIAVPALEPVAVSATDLTRRCGEGDTAVDALRGVSLDVADGRLTAITGPSVFFADEPTGNLDSASSWRGAGAAAQLRRRARPDDRDGHARPARRHDGRPDPVHRRRTDRQGRALQYE